MLSLHHFIYRRRYMEPTRSADHYPVPMSAHASRLSLPRFPSSFPGPGPGSSMPSTSSTALRSSSPMVVYNQSALSLISYQAHMYNWILMGTTWFSDDVGGMKIPRLWQEYTESCGRHEKTSMVNENGRRDLEPFPSK